MYFFDKIMQFGQFNDGLVQALPQNVFATGVLL